MVCGKLRGNWAWFSEPSNKEFDIYLFGMINFKRGIVVSPPFLKRPTAGIVVRGGEYLPSQELRKYLLYWDEIDYVDNGLIHLDGGPEIDFLVKAKVAIRTLVEFPGGRSSGNGEFFFEAQQTAFLQHDFEEPGAWSLAQPVPEPFFVNAISSTSIEYELWNMLPVPKSDVPLEKILEFKEKRRDELFALRVHLDEMHQYIIASADIPRARNTQAMKLYLALQDIDKVLDEFGIRNVISSLRGYIAGEFTNIAGTGMGAAGIASLIALPPLITGLVGAGIALAVKPVLAPRPLRTRHPLIYVSNVHKKFRQ